MEKVESPCADGAHSVKCGHLPIEHGNHIGFLNDQGVLDCYMRPQTSAESPVQMCKSVVTKHTLINEFPSSEHKCSLDHDDGATNDVHNAVRHADHTDMIVNNELHHFENGHCHIIARRYLKRQESTDIIAIDDNVGTHQILRRRNSVARDSQPVAEEAHHEHSVWYKDRDSMRFVSMFVLTGGYFVVELVYGISIGSLALVADAMHMLSDFIALIIGFYATRVADDHATFKSTFGWTRFEVVGALMNSVFMLAICFSIFTEAVQRFILGAESENLAQGAQDLLIVAIVGLIVNLLGLVIFGHGHDHQHAPSNDNDIEHGHGQAQRESVEDVSESLLRSGPVQRHSTFSKLTGCIPRVTNLNIRGVLLHVLGDALGSVAVIVSAILIKYSTSPLRFLADPICSVFIVAIILVGTIPLVYETMSILLQQTPHSICSETLIRELMDDPEVFEIHDFHTWVLASNQLIASMHVILMRGADFMKVSDRLKLTLHSFGIHATTIQPEFVESLNVLYGRGTCHEPKCADRLCVRRSCCPDGNQLVQTQNQNGN